MSLLAEGLYHALFLLLNGRLGFHHLLVLDDHIHRMVGITDRIVLDDLLRVMVVSAVVQPGPGCRREVCRDGFDHFQCAATFWRAMRLAMGSRLVVVVHLELGGLRRRRGRRRRLHWLVLQHVLRQVVEIVVVGHCSVVARGCCY